VNVSEFRQHYADYMNQVEHKGKPLAIMRNKTPAVLMIPAHVMQKKPAVAMALVAELLEPFAQDREAFQWIAKRLLAEASETPDADAYIVQLEGLSFKGDNLHAVAEMINQSAHNHRARMTSDGTRMVVMNRAGHIVQTVPKKKGAGGSASK